MSMSAFVSKQTLASLKVLTEARLVEHAGHPQFSLVVGELTLWIVADSTSTNNWAQGRALQIWSRLELFLCVRKHAGRSALAAWTEEEAA
jgi:hypothetical protein